MKLNWKSLLSIKTSAIVVFILIWTTGILYALFISGGGFSGLTSEGLAVTGNTCMALAVFSFLIAVSKPLQNVVIDPTRKEYFNVMEFYFLAAFFGVLSVARFILPLTEFNNGSL